jgi:hypothetical protein
MSARALVKSRRARNSRRAPVDTPVTKNLMDLRLDQLREAIRANLVSFPSPPPVFDKHDRPDLQWKLVELYFVMGWNCEPIAQRYGLIRQRIGQILKAWKRRAIEMGYIQYLPPLEQLLAGLADGAASATFSDSKGDPLPAASPDAFTPAPASVMIS